MHPAKGWSAVPKTCETCGNDFAGWDCHRHCPDCPRSKRRKKPSEERRCASCGEVFVLGLNGERVSAKRKFCDTCRSEGRKSLKASSRKCKWCGNDFQPGWTRGEAELCSRKCQGYWINAQGLGPKHDDEKLLKRIIKAIQTMPHLLSQEMLIEATGVTHKTLKARGWTMEFLYKQAGRHYGPPGLDSYCEDRAYSALQSIFPDDEIITQAELQGLVSEKGRKLPLDFYVPAHQLIVEIDGPQHLGSRGGFFPIERTQANDRSRDRFAKENGLIMVRLPDSAVRSTIKRKVREALRDSNAASSKTPAPEILPRRIATKKTKEENSRETPLHDVYCRGCHARPSFKHRSTYLCDSCWEISRDLQGKDQAIPTNEVESFRKELTDWIRERGRYVWHPEVRLHFRTISINELKRHGIKVTKICRELGFFAPGDDRDTALCVERVKAFVADFKSRNGKPPSVQQTLSGAEIDHETLWSCMNFEEFIRSLGGRIPADVHYRFRDADDFLNQAAEIVRKAGGPLIMTRILKQMNLSYPAYLQYFRSVRRAAIHKAAGVPMLE